VNVGGMLREFFMGPVRVGQIEDSHQLISMIGVGSMLTYLWTIGVIFLRSREEISLTTSIIKLRKVGVV
jgi:hypothetical protein